jgi:hypothetical protein
MTLKQYSLPLGNILTSGSDMLRQPWRYVNRQRVTNKLAVFLRDDRIGARRN